MVRTHLADGAFSATQRVLRADVDGRVGDEHGMRRRGIQSPGAGARKGSGESEM